MIERKLTFDARAGEQRIGLLYLCRFLKAVLTPPKTIVEVGSYCGASSRIIAESFPGAELTCVDPWKPYTEDCTNINLDKQALELVEAESMFDEMVESVKNVIKCKSSSIEASVSTSNGSLDFAYIDGNHQTSSVLQDLCAWSTKIKHGGSICGHDYPWPSVQSALKTIFNMTPDAVFCDGSWVYFV